jgi:hypothetical protein
VQVKRRLRDGIKRKGETLRARTSLRPDETIEHLLKALELTLVNLSTRLQSISEDRRASTTHQGRCLSLPRRLHLAARAAEDVAQDLPKNVSSGCPRLARSGGTSLCGYVDLNGTERSAGARFYSTGRTRRTMLRALRVSPSIA